MSARWLLIPPTALLLVMCCRLFYVVITEAWHDWKDGDR